MRRSLFALFFTSALLSVTACQSEKKDLLALPAAYNPKDADLTFNKKNLDAFNTMNESARKKHVDSLKETPGSFSGQAVFEAGNGLSPTVEESKHGDYELFAHVNDPVLYEITIDYRIFTSEALGRPIAPNKAIAFKGTLLELRFDDMAKPRKLTITVKADNVETITDKTPAAAPAAAPAAPAAPAS
ncbi:MAG: hypothetical protein JNL82_11015 [Myxococcales bacterium]|jgi:hypothetical protein|nr:hypothetical protein [Myxococcales bacterium]